MTPEGVAHAGSYADVALACQLGGYLRPYRSDGSLFIAPSPAAEVITVSDYFEALLTSSQLGITC